MEFPKRIYNNPKVFLNDLWFAARNQNRLRKLNKKHYVSSALRERLMLAVTAVNACRYCSYFHARQALKSGLSKTEINGLLSGDVAGGPEDEAVAVTYAQHWAETNAHPDPLAVEKLQQTYGPEKTEVIHLLLRMIRLANFSGNSWDCLMYHLSFHRIGL
jgi:AhpD family alkylhydroperoxidase